MIDISTYPIKIKLGSLSPSGIFKAAMRINKVTGHDPIITDDFICVPGILEISIPADPPGHSEEEDLKKFHLELATLDAAILKIHTDQTLAGLQELGISFNLFVRADKNPFLGKCKSVDILNLSYTPDVKKEKSQEEIQDLVNQTKEKIQEAIPL